MHSLILVNPLYLNNLYLIVKCATLASPANGHVTFSTNGSHSLVTYSCDVGFSIKDDGVSIDTCQSNGSWTYSPPICGNPFVHTFHQTLILL